MLIKSVKLNNIRSYTNHKLEFPTGSVLLSGDIGTGKSTILLAIEFALFGIRRVQLPGSALLRHEKKTGSVELKFEIDGKEIIINRNLKRVKDDVKQDAGYIIIDGRKKDLTPVELKSHVLNLLGYPKELVSKSRDVIYRYTAGRDEADSFGRTRSSFRHFKESLQYRQIQESKRKHNNLHKTLKRNSKEL